jgi:hypothetical protein
MRARWAWRVAAGCVVATWVWIDAVVDWDAGGFRNAPFSWFWDVAVFFVALPASLAAELLLRTARRPARLAGFAFLSCAAAVLSVGVFLTGLQICFEPQDPCRSTVPVHVAHLLTPLAVLAAGYAVERRRVLP